MAATSRSRAATRLAVVLCQKKEKKRKKKIIIAKFGLVSLQASPRGGCETASGWVFLRCLSRNAPFIYFLLFFANFLAVLQPCFPPARREAELREETPGRLSAPRQLPTLTPAAPRCAGKEPEPGRNRAPTASQRGHPPHFFVWLRASPQAVGPGGSSCAAAPDFPTHALFFRVFF